MAPTIGKEIAESNAPLESHPVDSAVQSAQVPANEEIARLAYALWEARGGMSGSAEEDWLMAEAKLR
jgi:hypothetical protein